MKLLTIAGAAVVLAYGSLLCAQTVTVNKSAVENGTTIFNSINGALAVDPDVIEITDSEVYEEIFTITSPVSIVGNAEDRPTLTPVSNPAGGWVSNASGATNNTGGIVINLPESMTTGTVKLHNLVILPVKNTPPEQRLRMAIENQNNNLYLELDNVLISANNGNDEPLSPDGMNSLVASFLPTHGNYNENHIPFGANGIVLGRTSIDGIPVHEGDGVELLVKDSVVTHFRNDYIGSEPERFPKCIQMHNPYTDMDNPDPAFTRIVRVEGESVISHARVGIEMAGDLYMHSDGQNIQMIGHQNQALDFVAPAVNARTIENVTFTNMGQINIWDRGRGQVRFTMRNCLSLFTLNTILHITGSAPGTILIEDSTLVGGRFHPTAGKANVFNFTSSTNCDIVVRDSILGGKENHSAANPGTQDLIDIWNHNVIALDGTNNLTLDGTALIGEGLYSFKLSETNEFLGINVSATSSVTGQPTTTADPQFVHSTYTDPLNPDFLDVVNPAYALANSSGGPLGGGADYVGVSGVLDWSVY